MQRGARVDELDTEAEVHLDPESSRRLAEQVTSAWTALIQAQHEFTRALRRMDLVHGCSVEGALSTASWLRHHCRLTAAEASRQVMVARQLDHLPHTAAAYEACEISYEHSARIAACARKLGVEVVREGEEALVEAARRLDPFQLGLVLQHLEHMVDPDGSLTFFERRHRHRSLALHRTSDGMYVLRGMLDAEGGALIASGLEAVMGPPPEWDERSPWQRRADALVDVFQRRLEEGGRARIVVTAELATLRGLRGAPAGELPDQLPLHSEAVRRLACDCVLQRACDCPGGEHAVSTRTIPPRLRRRLEARDGGCRFPGCDRPARWTDGHHVVAWQDGGPTTLDNLVLLCRPHHRMVHEGGWRLVPNGSVLRAHPPWQGLD